MKDGDVVTCVSRGVCWSKDHVDAVKAHARDYNHKVDSSTADYQAVLGDAADVNLDM